MERKAYDEFIANVSGKGKREKIAFIKEVLEFSELKRMASFNPKKRPRVSPDEIPQVFLNPEKELRKWILVEGNRIYCVYCLCFSRSEDEISTCGIDFTQKGARLSQKLSRHEISGTHALAKDIYENLSTDPSHDNPLRESVKCIIKSILFLATHGLGFHGNSMQKLDCFNVDKEKNYFKCQNEGKFLGLLKLLSGENADLRNHLLKCKEQETRNNIMHGHRERPSFLTHEFISEVLYTARSTLITTIVSEIILCGGKYGLEVDTSQDITSKQMCSMVVRYVDVKGCVHEHTVALREEIKGSGQEIFNLIDSTLREIGLETKKIVGFSFDGAASMRSENVGVNYFLRQENPGSLYVWCFSHRLNLVIKHACSKSRNINLALGLAEATALFIKGSTDRVNIWSTVVAAVPKINSNTRMKLISKTRWSSKHDIISSLVKSELNLYVVIKALIVIIDSLTLDGLALTSACDSLNGLLKFENIITFYVLHQIFNGLNETTKDLQEHAISIFDAINNIRKLNESLLQFEENLPALFKQAEIFVRNVNKYLKDDPKIQSTNVDCAITIPADDKQKGDVIIIAGSGISLFVNSLLLEIKERFLNDFDESESSNIFKEMSHFDPARFNKPPPNETISVKNLLRRVDIDVSNETKVLDELKQLAEEMPGSTNSKSISISLLHNSTDTENNDIEDIINGYDSDDEGCIPVLIVTESDVEDIENNIDNPLQVLPTLQSCNCIECILIYISESPERQNKYSNINLIYRYISCLPCTEVKCERDFSKMKIIKNRLRSSLGNKNMESLLILSAEAEMFKNIHIEDIIDQIIGCSKFRSKYLSHIFDTNNTNT